MLKDVNLTQQLKRYFGFDKFKGDQEAIVRNLLDGNDTFVLMPTGGGKSLCYQLPSLIMEGTAIVVSPLIALMKNQVDVINAMSEEDGVAHYLNSSLNKAAIDQVKADILSGHTKLLYVAPESLNKDENVEFLRSVKISFYAIDEAHCISEWGHDFRPEYRNIRPTIQKIGNAPVIALTATATDKVRADIKKSLGIVDAKEFNSSFNRPNLYYEVRPKTNEINKQIIRFIKQNPGKSGFVYCLSRKKVEELAADLCANDIKAAAYHAGLESAKRSETQDDFLMEKIDIIVATIAFGMGIDKPDVRFVIHYDIPKSLEGYYQKVHRLLLLQGPPETGEIHGGETRGRTGYRAAAASGDGSLCRVVGLQEENAPPLFRRGIQTRQLRQLRQLPEPEDQDRRTAAAAHRAAGSECGEGEFPHRIHHRLREGKGYR